MIKGCSSAPTPALPERPTRGVALLPELQTLWAVREGTGRTGLSCEVGTGNRGSGAIDCTTRGRGIGGIFRENPWHWRDPYL